jgi:hypothetical protein
LFAKITAHGRRAQPAADQLALRGSYIAATIPSQAQQSLGLVPTVSGPAPPLQAAPLVAATAAVVAMMNGADIKKAVTNQAKKVATTAAIAANGNGNGQKKRRKGDNLKPIITSENAGSSLHESPTQADAEYV